MLVRVSGVVSLLAVSVVVGLMAQPVRADDISVQIDSARTAYGRGDGLHTLSALQSAVNALNAKLADQLGKIMPPPPPGWDASAPEAQSLDSVGGGVAVARGYTKDTATLNAMVMVDNPAIGNGGASLNGKPGWSRIKLGSEEAMLRFDPQTRTGEVILLVGERALLQVEANDIGSPDALVDAAKGWNLAGLRKLLGSGLPQQADQQGQKQGGQ